MQPRRICSRTSQGDLLPDQDTSHDERELEQQYVTMLYHRLDGLRDYAATRLSRVLLETGGTPGTQ